MAITAHVRFVPIADICFAKRHVRFTPESRQSGLNSSTSRNSIRAKDCLKYCQERCGGMGNYCLGNCQQRCGQNNREKGGSYKSVADL